MVLSVEQFVVKLCEKTNLDVCDEIAAEFSKTVNNADAFKKYSKEIINIRHNGSLEAKLKNHILSAETIANNVMDESLLLDIDKDLKDVKTREEFEDLLNEIRKTAGIGLSWWGRIKQISSNIWSVMTRVANAIVKKVKQCLSSTRCLMVILLALWIVYCYLWGTTTEEEPAHWDIQAFQRPVYVESQDHTMPNGPCGMTWTILDYIKSFFTNVWTMIKNGFMSIFGYNDGYIIPEQFNYMSTAEYWDYTLYRQATNVGSGAACSGVSYMAGWGASLTGTGVGAAPGLMIFGTAVVIGGLCFGVSNHVNESVMKDITKEQYIAYERMLLRPFIIALEQKIVNFTIDKCIEDEEQRSTWKSMHQYILLLADITNGLRAFTTNLKVVVKETYGKFIHASALTVFGMTSREAKVFKDKMLEHYKKTGEVQKLTMKDMANRQVMEAGEWFKKIKFNPNDPNYVAKMNDMDKLQVIVQLKNAGQIDIEENRLKRIKKSSRLIQKEWDKHFEFMKQFFRETGYPVSSVSELPDYMFDIPKLKI